MITRVLIADDEELERRAIRKILENEVGLEILEAQNGVQALELVTSEVSVAILDIKMPGLDGIQVAERLRQNHPDVAIIFLTAYDQFDYARSALRLQVDDFLLKPASATEVVSTLHRVLSRIASRENARQSSQSALVRLDSAIDLVAQRLRNDLAEGLPDPEHMAKFLELQGMDCRPLFLLECHPTQPTTQMNHLGKFAESSFTEGEMVALAGIRGQTMRVLSLGTVGETQPQMRQIRQFRETVRSESGIGLYIGAAFSATETVHLDAMVTAAHRAVTITNPTNPIMVILLGAEPNSSGFETKVAGSTPVPHVVTKALDIIETRMTQDISLNEVAALVGLSPSHLSRQLARATGKGFADCLAQFRIDSAKKYLANGSLTVKEVSHLVGFHDPAYFARVFRRLEGRSPADFRAEAEGAHP